MTYRTFLAYTSCLAVLVNFGFAISPASAKPKKKSEAAAIAEQPSETFAYRIASDKHIRVSIESVTVRGQEGFLPRNPNWLQLQVTVTNLSPKTLSWTGIKARLADGTVLAAADSAEDIKKPPMSHTASAAKSFGIGAGGHLVGMFLFPPAAVLTGVANLFGSTLSMDRSAKRARRFEEAALRADVLAPGTSLKGLVFVPAVTGQTGLIAFYSSGMEVQSLPIMRLPNPAGVAVVPSGTP